MKIVRKWVSAAGTAAVVALGAAVVYAGGVASVSVSPGALSIGQSNSGTFTLSVDSIFGTVPPHASNPPELTYCSSWTLHDDGTLECSATAKFTLDRGRNYTQNPVGAGEYQALITINVDASAPCGGVFEVPETVTATAGSGVDFGNGVLSVTRTVSLTVTCAPLVAVGGCSHGYWKTHGTWPAPFTQSTVLGSVFTIGSAYTGVADKTFGEALAFSGGRTLSDKARLLMVQGVAALLNAAEPGVNFSMTQQDVIDFVNTALATGDASAITAAAANLESQNHGSLFCGDVAGE